MTKRIFVSFAIEDRVYRDLLKGQSLNTGSPFEYTDMSVKDPWDTAWKDQVRTRIKGVNGVIALLSKNVLNAAGAKYEIAVARQEGKPVLGLFIHDDDHTKPAELGSAPAVAWTWDGVAKFIDGLT
jgi:hypothetical protein